MSILAVVLPVQTARAHEPPTIAPVRLDFDARQAPKNCNERATFGSLLTQSVGDNVLIPEANRRLVVRISRLPTGGKRADVTLLDVAGATVGEHHDRYFAKDECHKVLWDAARIAARLLGAFDKPPPPPPPPPPPEPLVCPAPPEPTPCPASSPTLPPPRIMLPASPIRRGFVGAGVFLGMTTMPEAAIGPALSLGFVPLSRWPGLQIEFDGAYASRNVRQGYQVETVPLFASACPVHHGLRLCGGLATTFVSANDTLHVAAAATLRMGTEFKLAGPFSIRADMFMALRFAQRTFGKPLESLDALHTFAAGATAMAVWSFQ